MQRKTNSKLFKIHSTEGSLIGNSKLVNSARSKVLLGGGGWPKSLFNLRKGRINPRERQIGILELRGGVWRKACVVEQKKRNEENRSSFSPKLGVGKLGGTRFQFSARQFHYRLLRDRPKNRVSSDYWCFRKVNVIGTSSLTAIAIVSYSQL